MSSKGHWNRCCPFSSISFGCLFWELLISVYNASCWSNWKKCSILISFLLYSAAVRFMKFYVTNERKKLYCLCQAYVMNYSFMHSDQEGATDERSTTSILWHSSWMRRCWGMHHQTLVATQLGPLFFNNRNTIKGPPRQNALTGQERQMVWSDTKSLLFYKIELNNSVTAFVILFYLKVLLLVTNLSISIAWPLCCGQ